MGARSQESIFFNLFYLSFFFTNPKRYPNLEQLPLQTAATFNLPYTAIRFFHVLGVSN